MGIFQDKVAVITGAGSGIGRALAVRLSREGARLALSDIDVPGLEKTCELLRSGCDVHSYPLDVSSQTAFFAHAKQVKRDFGGAHYLFNNAGATLVGTFEHIDVDEMEWLLGINLWGVIYGCKAFLPMMREQDEGCIVNISSIFGFVSFPGQSTYNISKFGVRALTECLWAELRGTGVRAVCVHPGGIKTNIEKSGRRCRVAGAEEAKFSASADKMLVTLPEQCAAEILDGIRRGRRRILTGKYSRSLYYLSRLLPNSYDAVLRKIAS
jgi:hypothetical protein